MYYIYILNSNTKKFRYIGFCSDLKKRFQEHNFGQVKSTKAYRPLDLIYYEAYNNKTAARKREIELKNNSQQKEILFKRLFGPLV